ncbi:polysaccharide biosynthesis protein [Arvimicrobium flavum]|uniref:polysaccharide biosynthesis protein n=1 Tax=Arvimicrobium flavum TaxID=3393320 RepID=UPI00237A414E|nr:nucleoside-diphosphate sugar epimerase/dehydratase [Mesorhizobium shangrilense]
MGSIVGWLIERPRRQKRALLAIIDFLILLFALWLSYTLRFGSPFVPTPAQMVVIAVAPAVAVPILFQFGFYRAVVRYVSETMLWSIVKAMAIAVPLWLVFVFMTEMRGMGVVPRSIPVIYFVMGTVLLAGSRFLARRFLQQAIDEASAPKRILIYGASGAGVQLAAALRVDPHSKVVGFIDDDEALVSADISGVRVYPVSALGSLIPDLEVQEIIVCSDSVASPARGAMLRQTAKLDVKVSFLPTIAAGWEGDLTTRVRDIELGDLLGRAAVAAAPALLGGPVKDKTVLVTGAGGSIGSELCRQIVTLGPRRLILFDVDEFALYEIERSLKDQEGVELVPVLGSVTDAGIVRRTFERHPIDSVFHAAAYKHVPMVEANMLSGIANNIFGTWTVAEAAFDAKVEHFVLISSDKAVRPANVMGATKRWSEIVVRSFANRPRVTSDRHRFCAVRFGNVIGSQGSVVPLFKEQIASGGPVTLTEEGMTRYFMSIREAAELIIQAASLSQNGDVFLLDMGEPVAIRELAENMIRFAGLTLRDASHPNGDIEIKVIGSRPGEKLYEELFYDASYVEPTAHPRIMRGKRRNWSYGEVCDTLTALRKAVDSGDEASAKSLLFAAVGQAKQTPAA